MTHPEHNQNEWSFAGKLRKIIPSKGFGHWTPEYLYNRLKLYLFELAHPDCPWLTQYVTKFLSSWLRKTDVGLEYGSGRSSIWFARRVKHLTSIEHNFIWYEHVRTELLKHNLANVNLVYAEEKESYIKIIKKTLNNSVDFALIDGIYRDECALEAIRKIKPGGLLIIDNINWYLPSISQSPSSRAKQDKPASQIWKRLSELFKEWRCIWTSDGVTDTAIYIKPCLSPNTDE